MLWHPKDGWYPHMFGNLKQVSPEKVQKQKLNLTLDFQYSEKWPQEKWLQHKLPPKETDQVVAQFKSSVQNQKELDVQMYKSNPIPPYMWNHP